MPRSKARQETLRRIKALEAAHGITDAVKVPRGLRSGQIMFPRQWLPDVTLPDGSAIIHIGSVSEMRWVSKNQSHCGRHYKDRLLHGAEQMYIVMSPTFKVVLTITVVRRYQKHNRFRLDECVLKLNKRPSTEQENMIKAWIWVEPLRQEIRDRLRLNQMVDQLESLFQWYDSLIESGLPIKPPPTFLL